MPEVEAGSFEAMQAVGKAEPSHGRERSSRSDGQSGVSN